MSIWLHIFCKIPIPKITSDELHRASRERLTGIVAQCQSDPQGIHLFIEDKGGMQKAELYIAPGPTTPVFIERWTRTTHPDDFQAELDEFLEEISTQRGPMIARIRQHLKHTIESAAFELRDKHMQGAAWDGVLAVAAALALLGDGLIEVEGAWIQPDTRGLKYIHTGDHTGD